MSTEYAERHEETMRKIYGPFLPGSDARALRHENDQRGLRTCWHCLKGYRSLTIVSDGRRQRIGRGHFYCSWDCYRADRLELALRRHGIAIHEGVLHIDLRRLRESAA